MDKSGFSKFDQDGYTELSMDFIGLCISEKMKDAPDGPVIAGALAEVLGKEKETREISPLLYVKEVFRGDSFGWLCLLLALKCDTDPRAFDEAGVRRPTLAMAQEIHQMVFGAGSGSVYEYFKGEYPVFRLVFENTFLSSAESFLSAPLILRQQIYSFIMNGDIYPPESQSQTMRLFTPGEDLPPMIAPEAVIEKGRRAADAFFAGRTDILCFYGPEGAGKKFFVKTLFKERGETALFVDGEAFFAKTGPAGEDAFEALLTEVILTGAAPCIYAIDNEASAGRLLDRLSGSGVKGVCLIHDGAKPIDINRPMISVELELPGADESIRLWEYFGGVYGVSGDFTYPAANIVLTASQIEGAVRELSAWEREPSPRNMLMAGAAQMSHDLDKKASNVKLIFGWEDLIAEQGIIRKLKDACGHIKYKHKVFDLWGFREKMPYGQGLCMLFYGPSGTGKTMAAQVIARELGLSLYRIDLSRIISKYIGETEQNLNEIFNEAARTNAILFFDEADALFSKRTDVKDSNDKYSNAETAYLLQKTEEYGGVSILASNLMYNLDDAFRRRIHYTIYFSMPDRALRKRAWREVFPSAPFGGDVDFNFLAEKFELSPASIKQVILNAAFLSAAESGEITMKNIFKALKNEYSKTDKIMLKENLENYGDLW